VRLWDETGGAGAGGSREGADSCQSGLRAARVAGARREHAMSDGAGGGRFEKTPANTSEIARGAPREGAGGAHATRWRIVAFDALSAREAHDLLALRQAVFVIEQNCVFPEIDGRDPLALHVLGWRGETLVACARLLPAGAKMAARSIGRVATAASARGQGLGREAMAQAIAHLVAQDPRAPIELSAQAHLAEPFYAPMGFRMFGKPYDEDGIAHVDMRLRPS
jgi:ElaA protein